MAGAVLASAAYSVLLKPLLHRHHPIQRTALMLMLLGGLGAKCSTSPHANTASWLTVVYLGIAPGCLAYVAWGFALRTLSASQASCMLYTVPLTTLDMAHTIRHEVAAPMALVGGILAGVGALMMSTWAQHTIKA